MSTIEIDEEVQSGSKRSEQPSADRQHLDDVKRIAGTLAEQHGAPKDRWPLYRELAERLIKFSRRWYE